MAIINAQLTTTQLDIFEEVLGTIGVPANKTIAITNVLICNTSLTESASFDMHLVPHNQTVDNHVTMVIRELILSPSETFTLDSERIILDQGDKLVFVAQPDIGSNNTNLAATISYLEI